MGTLSDRSIKILQLVTIFTLIFIAQKSWAEPQQTDATDSVKKFQQIEQRALKRKTMYISVLQNRIVTELNSGSKDVDLLRYIFKKFKEYDPQKYRTFLTTENTISGDQSCQKEESNAIFNAVSVLMENLTVEDGLMLLSSYCNKESDKAGLVERAFYFLLMSDSPLKVIELYNLSAELRKNLSEERLKTQLSVFCLSTKLTLQTAKCLDAISSYQGKVDSQWAFIEAASAYLTVGNIAEFENTLKKMNLKDPSMLCGEELNNKNLRGSLQLGSQYFRIKKDYQKSLNCIDKMGSTQFTEKFIKNFESMKTYRLMKNKEYKKYLDLAEEAIPQGNSFQFLHTLVDVEKIKNQIFLKVQSSLSPKEMEGRLSAKGYVDLAQVIGQSIKYSEGQNKEIKGSTFELIDLKLLQESSSSHEK